MLPQLVQNLELRTTTAPHCGQTDSTAIPHPPQKRCLGPICQPHLGQTAISHSCPDGLAAKPSDIAFPCTTGCCSSLPPLQTHTRHSRQTKTTIPKFILVGSQETSTSTKPVIPEKNKKPPESLRIGICPSKNCTLILANRRLARNQPTTPRRTQEVSNRGHNRPTQNLLRCCHRRSSSHPRACLFKLCSKAKKSCLVAKASYEMNPNRKTSRIPE